MVEDNERLVTILQRELIRAGYAVETARRGFDPGYLLSEFKPELVLLDIMLPDISGEDVLKKLRSNGKNYPAKVLIMSGYVDAERKARLVQLSADTRGRTPR